MRKLAYIILCIVLFSCGEEKAEKPKRLLKEDVMVNMLYDITLLQAINSYTPQVLNDNKVDGKNYIYKKYKTDSLTFAQNHQYYASDLEVYEGIQKKVAAKIEKDKVKYGTKKKEASKVKVRTRTKTIKPDQNKALRGAGGKSASE